MVAPITGPFTTSQSLSIDGEGSYRITRTRYRQKKPFNKALPYRFTKLVTLEAWIARPDLMSDYGGFANANTAKSPEGYYASAVDSSTLEVIQALNVARDRFIGKISERSEMLVNLAEREQAMQMMTNRLTQMWQFSRALRKGQFGNAARYLVGGGDNQGVVRSWRRKGAKKFADNFLEAHFGWQPLVQDIYAAAEILDSDFGEHLIRGRARVPVKRSRSIGYSGVWARTGSDQGHVVAEVGARVRVNNPNAALLSRMGLINPATVAWELVPFSFVVDWFVNVGEYLAQFTDLIGLDVVEPYHTYMGTVTNVANYYLWVGGRKTIVYGVSSSAISVERKLGLPSVTLRTRPPWRLSPSRALTAISLLIQKGFK